MTINKLLLTDDQKEQFISSANACITSLTEEKNEIGKQIEMLNQQKDTNTSAAEAIANLTGKKHKLEAKIDICSRRKEAAEAGTLTRTCGTSDDPNNPREIKFEAMEHKPWRVNFANQHYVMSKVSTTSNSNGNARREFGRRPSFAGART